MQQSKTYKEKSFSVNKLELKEKNDIKHTFYSVLKKRSLDMKWNKFDYLSKACALYTFV